MSQPCAVEIRPERNSYVNGDVIRARFTLSPKEALKFDIIRIGLVQEESASTGIIKSTDKKLKTLYTRTVHEAPNTQFQPRPYIYEMEYKIADDAAPTWQKNQSNFSLRIRHYLFLFCEKSGLLNKNVFSEQDIRISVPPIYQLLGINLPHRFQGDKALTGLMGINKGKIGWNVSLEKTHFGLGESININLTLDNTQSKVDFKGLNIQLRRNFGFGMTPNDRKNSQKSEILDQLSMSDFPLSSGQSSTNKYTLKVPSALEQFSFDSLYIVLFYDIFIELSGKMFANASHEVTIYLHPRVTSQFNF